MACEKISANAELFQSDGIKLDALRPFLYSATQLVVALAAPRYSTNSFLSSKGEKHYEAEDEISAVRREYVFPAKDAEKCNTFLEDSYVQPRVAFLVKTASQTVVKKLFQILAHDRYT